MDTPGVQVGSATQPLGLIVPGGLALHRLAEVRAAEGISRGSVARRLRLSRETVELQEQPTTDLLLSTLYAWQQVLNVPAAELLLDANCELSSPVHKRAQMVRVMKTAAAIFERTEESSTRRLAQMLIEQLCEVMPEVRGVAPWHAGGKGRTLNELGQAAYRRLPDGILEDKDA